MLRSAPALSPEIAALLSRAMFPDPARIARALEAYRSEPGLAVFIWEVGGVAVSAAGVRVAGPEAEVLHIGTRPDGAGQGHGRALLWAVAAHLKLSRLVAETDDDAVAFYRRSGFEIRDALDRGGRRRYLCTLSPER